MDFGLRSVKANWAALPLELIVGVIFFAHGLQKLGDPAGYAANLLGGIPMFLIYLVIAAEFGGGLLLLSGFLVRLGALGHLCVMAVAISRCVVSNSDVFRSNCSPQSTWSFLTSINSTLIVRLSPR